MKVKEIEREKQMKDYKRLTFRCYDAIVRLLKDTKFNSKEAEALIEALYRLAELEDKIEDGTLIELPCIRKCETHYQVLYQDNETKQVTYISYGLNDLWRAEERLKEIKKCQ